MIGVDREGSSTAPIAICIPKEAILNCHSTTGWEVVRHFVDGWQRRRWSCIGRCLMGRLGSSGMTARRTKLLDRYLVDVAAAWQSHRGNHWTVRCKGSEAASCGGCRAFEFDGVRRGFCVVCVRRQVFPC